MESNQNRARNAFAQLRGGREYPKIRGQVNFKQLPNGVLVTVRVNGLPDKTDGMGIFAFHIHEGSRCAGNSQDEFADVKGHYNPEGNQHPYHAGDLPPLFGNHGFAYMSVFTDRFSVRDIIGRTVIIHSGVDDFTTQPSGNAGAKIACGQIMRG